MASRDRPGSPSFDHGAQYFTARSPEFREEVSRWQRAGLVAPWEAPLGVFEGGRLRPRHRAVSETRYVGVPTSRALLSGLAVGLDVRSGVEVARIEARSGSGYRLWDRAGNDLGTYPRVVITAPAPQAVRLLRGVAPTLSEAAENVRFLPTWAVLVSLPEPLDLPYGGVFINEGPLSWLAREGSKPNRGSEERLVLHASSAWSLAHLEHDPEVVTTHLVAALGTVLGGAELRPRSAVAHRWRFARPEETEETRTILSAHGGTLSCGGDWSGGGGRVEAAWGAGQSLARGAT